MNFSREVEVAMKEMLRLRDNLTAAEEAYKKAKRQYTDFNEKVLTDMMALNGITSLKLTNGLTATVVTKTNVHVNKENMQKVTEWLAENDGEHLVHREMVVPEDRKELLQTLKIPFEEVTNVNTTSLKSFLLDRLGQKGGYAYINKENIPEGISFYQHDVVEFKEPLT